MAAPRSEIAVQILYVPPTAAIYHLVSPALLYGTAVRTLVIGETDSYRQCLVGDCLGDYWGVRRAIGAKLPKVSTLIH